MRVTHTLSALPFVAMTVAACFSTTSGEGTGSSGSSLSCPEFQVGSTFDSSTDVDVHVRAFMQASADLGQVSAGLRKAVKTACIGVATDLGAQDTWSALGDTDDAISNGNGTGACDVARAHAVAVMKGNVNANFALVVARGHCYPDFDAETKCEVGCQADVKCNPGTVETRCSPGHLNVQCQDKCAAQSYCEGTVDVQTQCEGSCEAECAGSCSGSCTDEDGHRRDNDPSCHGKCKGHCSGTCSGRCQIDVTTGVQCGSNVTCTGVCMGSYTSPRCETDFTPPTCTSDATCVASCRAHAVSTAKCDPDTVKLLADVTVSGDVAKLVASIDKNLPPLLQTAEAQGRLSFDIIQEVVSSGQSVLSASGSLSLHSAACATEATESLAATAKDLDVSVKAGTAAEQDLGSNAD